MGHDYTVTLGMYNPSGQKIVDYTVLLLTYHNKGSTDNRFYCKDGYAYYKGTVVNKVIKPDRISNANCRVLSKAATDITYEGHGLVSFKFRFIRPFIGTGSIEDM